MKLVKRLKVLARLRHWLEEDGEQWKQIKRRAFENNKWFTEAFVDHRVEVINRLLLDQERLQAWVAHYHVDDNIRPQKVGIVMAGNIPLVGFHDLLCCFVTGHHAYVKLSEKDAILLKGLVDQMKIFDPAVGDYVFFAEMLKGCDAYIATGSNNTSRYFEYYFGRYPSIIRKNRTSVAILSGMENNRQLELLADDVFLYFGLGCRNVAQLYVPEHFDFKPLLKAFQKKYGLLKDHDKFRNNYDYNLALLIMNNRQYMSNDCVIMVEEDLLFSPVSELYYASYTNEKQLADSLLANDSIQCVVGKGHIGFGKSQQTGLYDYADGIDTMQFLLSL